MVSLFFLYILTLRWVGHIEMMDQRERMKTVLLEQHISTTQKKKMVVDQKWLHRQHNDVTKRKNATFLRNE